MIDKYTFFQYNTAIQNAFARVGLDVRSVRFSGGFLFDDPTNSTVVIKPPYSISDRQRRGLEQLLFEQPGAVLAEAHMEIGDPNKPLIREIGWQRLMEFGVLMSDIADTIIANLDTLSTMRTLIENKRFQNFGDLERHLDEFGIHVRTLRSMIFVGTHYFECVGAGPYMRTNMYRVLNIRCQTADNYERAKQVFAYAIHWNPHYTAANNQVAIMSKILELDAVRLNDDRDQYGDLCLHKAVFCRHKEMVELLLERGADPTIPNHHGSTALDVEALMRCPEIREMLQTQVERNHRARYEQQRMRFFHGRGNDEYDEDEVTSWLPPSAPH